MYIFTYKYVLIRTICIMVYVSCTYYMYIYVQYGIRPDQYVFLCILYVYTYINTYRFVYSGAEDLRLSRRSRAQVVRQIIGCSQSQRLDWNLDCWFYPRDTVTSKTKKGRHPAKAYIFLLPKEERAGPTSCFQFMAEPDFCTGRT